MRDIRPCVGGEKVGNGSAVGIREKGCWFPGGQVLPSTDLWVWQQGRYGMIAKTFHERMSASSEVPETRSAGFDTHAQRVSTATRARTG